MLGGSSSPPPVSSRSWSPRRRRRRRREVTPSSDVSSWPSCPSSASSVGTFGVSAGVPRRSRVRPRRPRLRRRRRLPASSPSVSSSVVFGFAVLGCRCGGRDRAGDRAEVGGLEEHGRHGCRFHEQGPEARIPPAASLVTAAVSAVAAAARAAVSGAAGAAGASSAAGAARQGPSRRRRRWSGHGWRGGGRASRQPAQRQLQQRRARRRRLLGLGSRLPRPGLPVVASAAAQPAVSRRSSGRGSAGPGLWPWLREPARQFRPARQHGPCRRCGVCSGGFRLRRRQRQSLQSSWR